MNKHTPLDKYLTTPLFWSCNCPTNNHVHPKGEMACIGCQMYVYEGDDALIMDVLRHYFGLDICTTVITDWVTEADLDREFHNLTLFAGDWPVVKACKDNALLAVREIKRAIITMKDSLIRTSLVQGWTAAYYVYLNYARQITGRDLYDTERLHWSSTRQAADLMGVHQTTVQKWCRNGKIKDAFILGRDWNIPTVSLVNLKKGPSRWE